jgi:hypothetical protein
VEIYGNIRDKTSLELTTILKTKINNQVKKKNSKLFSEEKKKTEEICAGK